MMGSMSSAAHMSITSNGPHPASSERPHTCRDDGRFQAGPRQSFQRMACETLPPERKVVMPISARTSAADCSTGSGEPALSCSRPHAPGMSVT